MAYLIPHVAIFLSRRLIVQRRMKLSHDFFSVRCLVTYFSLRLCLQFYAEPGVFQRVEVTNQPI